MNLSGDLFSVLCCLCYDLMNDKQLLMDIVKHIVYELCDGNEGLKDMKKLFRKLQKTVILLLNLTLTCCKAMLS